MPRTQASDDTDVGTALYTVKAGDVLAFPCALKA